MKDETELCHLCYPDPPCSLTCIYNHTAGALCLANKCEYCNELLCTCYGLGEELLDEGEEEYKNHTQ